MTTRTTRRMNGGHLNYKDVSRAHPAIGQARDSLLGPTPRTAYTRTTRVPVMIRRTAWFIADRYPGVHPDQLGEDFRRAERAWVKEMYFSKCLRGRAGAWLLFEELKALGLRDAALPNPYEYVVDRGNAWVAPPPLPVELAARRAELDRHLEHLVRVRRDTKGKQGVAEEWRRAQMRALDDLAGFIVERNARESHLPAWNLDLATIFGDPEVIASYLWSGVRRANGDGEVSELTRLYRKTALLSACRFFVWRGYIAPGFPEKLAAHLRQGTSQIMLGGRAAKVIEALDKEDVAKARAFLASEKARVDAKFASDPSAEARVDRARAYRKNAVFEFLLGTGVREQGAASLDERRFGVNERGSVYVDDVQVKMKAGKKSGDESTYYRRQWVPRRALRAIAAYVEVTGRRLALRPGDQQILGKRLDYKKGAIFAGTPMSEDCDRYPVFRDDNGDAMAPEDIGEMIRRVLRRSRAACDRAHVLRHTACAIAVNDWHVAPSEAARVYGWGTVAMVLERYSKGPVDRIWEKFDALSDGEGLAPDAIADLVEEIIGPLFKLLVDLREKPTGNAVPLLWNALVEALDQMGAIDPKRPRLQDTVMLSTEEMARVELWIRERSDRHESASSIAGRPLVPGFPVPQAPDEQIQGGEAVAA